MFVLPGKISPLFFTSVFHWCGSTRSLHDGRAKTACLIGLEEPKACLSEDGLRSRHKPPKANAPSSLTETLLDNEPWTTRWVGGH